MFKFIKKIFNNKEVVEEKSNTDVECLDFNITGYNSDNYTYHKDRKNIAIVDDDPGLCKTLLLDLSSIDNLASKLRNGVQLNSSESQLYSLLTTEEKKFLNEYRLASYNVITYTTISAGFFLIKDLMENKDKKIDIAFIDLVYGKSLLIDDKLCFVDGIDVLKHILKHNNEDLKYVIYTGSSTGSMSDFAKKFKTCVDPTNELKDFVVDKSPIVSDRQKHIIEKLLNESNDEK
jgi:hypothetical protein